VTLDPTGLLDQLSSGAQQAASQAGSSFVQGASQAAQQALPDLAQQAQAQFQPLIGQAAQALQNQLQPLAGQAAQALGQAAGPAAFQLGQQAGAGARQGALGGLGDVSPTTWLLVGGGVLLLAVVGVAALKSSGGGASVMALSTQEDDPFVADALEGQRILAQYDAAWARLQNARQVAQAMGLSADEHAEIARWRERGALTVAKWRRHAREAAAQAASRRAYGG
jgi:hypothetical protein